MVENIPGYATKEILKLHIEHKFSKDNSEPIKIEYINYCYNIRDMIVIV